MTEFPAVLMPGGLRMRALQPLVDRQGACRLIYDLERNLLVEVPMEYQLHIAFALDKGDPDEALISFLAGEDLMTYEWAPPQVGPERSLVTELSDFSGGLRTGGFGCVYLVDDRLHCQMGAAPWDGVEAMLDWVSRRAEGSSRVTLHLAAGDRLDFPRLERVVEQGSRFGETFGRAVDFELSVAARAVTREVAAFLDRHPFHVRVRCDGPMKVEGVPLAREPRESFRGRTARGVLRLSSLLGDRLTVHAMLASGARLAYLWDWARELGLSHLHVTKTTAEDDDALDQQLAVRDFRSDLTAVCDEMFYTLQAGDKGLLYEPVVRVVRRMLGRRAPSHAAGWSAGTGRTSCLGVVSNGRVFPLSGRMPVREAIEVDETAGGAKCGPSRCSECWGRSLCGRGTYADPSLTAAEKLGADTGTGHCDPWRVELEAGLLFYHRLREADPDYLLGFADPAVGRYQDPFESFESLGELFELKTC